MHDYSSLIRQVAEAVEEMIGARFARPTATYRLQFSPKSMTFADVEALVPYLEALGVSHLYASPCLKSRNGANGYAIADYSQLNPELGGAEGHGKLVEELHRHNMGQILDIVPNHMSAADENRWWRDILENGPSSPYAPYFDIDWSPVNEALQGKILLPLLGDQYGKVLDAGELKLVYQGGSFCIRYFEMSLPLDPKTYRPILSLNLEAFREAMPADSEELRELESILTALEHLPERTETAPALVAERQREKEVVKDRLVNLMSRSAAIADFILHNVERYGGRREEPHSFDRLDSLLDSQVYRLCHWKAAADEINYRRFFDINELAAICMEEPNVFEESHRLIIDLLVRGDANGLRIDHIDGLYDPQEYLHRLHLEYLRGLGRNSYQHVLYGDARFREGEGPEMKSETPINAPLATSLPSSEASPASRAMPEWKDIEPYFMQEMCNRYGLDVPLFDLVFQVSAENVQIVGIERGANEKTLQPPLFVVVEKILGPEEPIPKAWPVAGTTGYDFNNHVGGLFIDSTGFAELQKIYNRFIDDEMNFREVSYQSKLLILRVAMSSDMQLLAHRLNRLSERHRHFRDFTLNELRTALREVIACFPVYRTYIRKGEVSEQDRQFICRATAHAKRRNPARNPALFDFIRAVLLLETPPDLDETGILERAMFVGRFQQTTSPVMAKGIEDTAFYRYCPLASLGEVGGDPTRGAILPEEFHRQNLLRQSQWPQSLICTSTHDTKHSDDVRARINVLSEIPSQWRSVLNRWSRLNRRHHREVDGRPAPSRNDEYLFYQNLVGIWPLEPPDAKMHQNLIERMQQYMEKATREAKLHTSWINPIVEYETAVREFVAVTLKNHPKNRFLAEFCNFQEQIVNWGLYGALSQTLLKLTSPGVPDIYQGQELWDFSLVDPDNRRPVDFAIRQNLLMQLKDAIGHNEESLLDLTRELASHPRDPRMKMFVTWRTLQFRRLHADLFNRGEYIPLSIVGSAAKHICAFARRWTPANGRETQIAIVAAPRLIAQLMMATPNTLATSPPIGPLIWKDTRLSLKEFNDFSPINLFTGQAYNVKEGWLSADNIFSTFPVAVLVNSE